MLTKVCLVKAMVFPVVMYGCESWTIKEAECQRIDAFKLLCWRRLWRVPWIARSNCQSQRKSALNIHWKYWCWSWSSNTWPPDAKSQLIGKVPDARKDGKQREMGRKKMRWLDSIWKSKDIILLTKVPIIKAMVFPVVMYRCERWTMKKVEHWRIDAFELWCWRRLLRVPWSTRRSSQSILKEISPEYSLEGPMLNLKLQYLATWCKELTHLKRPWCWERLKAGGEGDGRGQDGWVASPTQWTWVWASSGS